MHVQDAIDAVVHSGGVLLDPHQPNSVHIATLECMDATFQRMSAVDAAFQRTISDPLGTETLVKAMVALMLADDGATDDDVRTLAIRTVASL